MIRAVTVWLCCGTMVLLSAGCGPSEGDVAPVNGRVTFEGRPLAGGTIVFSPDPTRGENGPVSVGRILDDGTFELTCKLGRGAVTGWHRVTIAAASGSAQLPKRLRYPEHSEISREVKPGRGNEFDFSFTVDP